MREMIWSALQNQFVHCPIQEMVVVLEEGYHPLMLYPKIDKSPPWMELNGRHQNMDMCTRGVERKLSRYREEESQASKRWHSRITEGLSRW